MAIFKDVNGPTQTNLTAWKTHTWLVREPRITSFDAPQQQIFRNRLMDVCNEDLVIYQPQMAN